MSSEPGIGKFDFEAVIFCEAVRREEGGKAILLGVYGGDVVLESYPQTLPLWSHIEGNVLEAGIFKARFRVIDGDGAPLGVFAEITSGSAPFIVGRYGIQVVLIVTLQRSTDIILQADLDGTWRTISKRTVVLRSELEQRFMATIL